MIIIEILKTKYFNCFGSVVDEREEVLGHLLFLYYYYYTAIEETFLLSFFK